MDERRTVHVLLIEDEHEDAYLFRRYAEGSELYALRVTHVTGVQQATEALADDKPDLVFLDLRLGGVDAGLALLRHITVEAPALPVIVLTGIGNEHMAVEAMKTGAVDYLVKDAIGPEAIERSIRHALEQHQAAVEREQAQRALRESEARYRALVEDMPALICRFLPDGTLTFVNDEYCACFGRKRSELIGSSFLQFIPEAERAAVRERYTSLTRENPVVSYEHPVVAPDGTVRHQRWTDRVLCDAAGRPVEFQSIGIDITERKEAEEALRRSEEKYRNVVEHASDGICLIQDGIIRYANSQMARMSGHCVEEVVGTPFLRYVHPDVAERLKQAYEDFVSRDDYEGRYRSALRHRDGQRVEIEFSASAAEYEGRRAVLVFVRDVTELKRAEREKRRLEAQMQRAQKLESLGVLAGGIAHDFNNLLVGVLGNAGLALMELPPESPARQSIERIRIAAERAGELCKQMLAYSGRGRFVIQPLNLSDLVREMGHLLQTAIQKAITLKYDFAEDLPAVLGDANELRQVIMNLITNAAEAIGDNRGIITIRTGLLEADSQYLATTYLAQDKPAGTYVCLEVSDTGCGMDEETKARIFDPFFTTKFTGRGLGLASVLGIVRGHRGAIKIYSEPGRGTTFKVLLPCSQRPPVDLENKDEPISDWDGSGAILVADDEQIVRTVAQKTLEDQGFTVLTAANGPEAVEILSQNADRVVLVLLDLTMPGISGLETFSRMRRVRRDVPVILSSGYSEEDAIGDFTGKDLAGFIQKPFDPKSLIRKVREVLRKQ